MLGGVDIEFDRGLAAHSDGDVLIPCVVRCVARAQRGSVTSAGHFPDTNPEFAGIDSRILLRAASPHSSPNGDSGP